MIWVLSVSGHSCAVAQVGKHHLCLNNKPLTSAIKYTPPQHQEKPKHYHQISQQRIRTSWCQYPRIHQLGNKTALWLIHWLTYQWNNSEECQHPKIMPWNYCTDHITLIQHHWWNFPIHPAPPNTMQKDPFGFDFFYLPIVSKLYPPAQASLCPETWNRIHANTSHSN